MQTFSDGAVPRTLFVSDEAYDNLILMARKAGYVKGTQTAKGLRHYVEHIMQCDMQDARPEDVRSQDAALRSAGYAAEWRMYSPRKRRTVKLTQATLFHASVQCVTLGITHLDRILIGAPDCINLQQCMSALLEAIGTDWVQIDDNEG